MVDWNQSSSTSKDVFNENLQRESVCIGFGQKIMISMWDKVYELVREFSAEIEL